MNLNQPRLRRYPRSEAKRYSRKRELQFQIQEDNSLLKKEINTVFLTDVIPNIFALGHFYKYRSHN
jgi:hypothetical protein